MDLFHNIPDSQAVLYAKGVYKQTELYRRGKRMYLKHGSGYVRIEGKTGNMWGTSVPSVMVVEYSVPRCFLEEGRFGEPLYK